MSEEDKAAVRDARARRHRRLPRPRLPRTRTDQRRTPQGDDGVARLRTGARRVRADAARGDGARRPRRRAAHAPRRRPRATTFPVVVIGCGESGLLAGIRLKEAGIPFTIVEKNAGRRRHLVPEHLSGRARRRRKSLLLLQLRTDRPVDALLRRAARAAGVLRARDGQARHRAARAVGDRGHRRHLGRRHRDVDRSHPRPPTARRRRCTRARGHQRRRAARPTAPARRSRVGRLRGHGLPLRGVGPLGRPARASASR